MKKFVVGETVNFLGSHDQSPVESTSIAWLEMGKKQAIIEHPDGHEGDQFTGSYGLDKNKTYIFVKTDHLENIAAEGPVTDVEAETDVVPHPAAEAAAEAAQPEPAPAPAPAPTPDPAPETEEAPAPEASAEMTAEDVAKAGEARLRTMPFSQVLEEIKQFRPEDESKMIDQMIGAAIAFEHSKLSPKELEKINKKASEKVAGGGGKASEEFAEDVAQPMADLGTNASVIKAEQEAERKAIIRTIDQGILTGALENRDGGFYLNGTVVFDEDNKESYANYLQNTPTDYVVLSTQVMEAMEKMKEGGSAEAESGSEETPAAPAADSKEEAPAAEAKEEAPTYEELLLSIEGVGPKTAKDIATVFPTLADLHQGVKDKKLAFSSKVDAAIKKAVKRKAFKL